MVPFDGLSLSRGPLGGQTPVPASATAKITFFSGLLMFLTLPASCAGATWDPAANFNAPNNPQASSVFSYGAGGSPAAFVPLSHLILNCVGTPTYCEDNGNSVPTQSIVTWNGTGGVLSYSITIVQPADMVRMDPQATTGTIVRFTAPWTDTYSLSGLFQAIDTNHNATTAYIYVNGKLNFTAIVGTYGQQQPFILSGLSLTGGETIDFLVMSDGLFGNLSTGLEATITSATNGPASQILPQLAFGGGWYTALYFTNTSSSPVSFTVSFTGDDGNPLLVPALGSSSVALNLAARGTVVTQLPNAGPLVQGYASAALPAGVTGYAVFRQSVPGVNDQEAVVPLSVTTATTCTLLFDDTNYITGVAVVNLASVSTSISVIARDGQGNTIGTSTISLAPLAKTSVVLRDLPGLAGVGGALGSVDFTAPIGNLAVLGLRFNGLAFTSIPVSGK